MSEGVRFTPVRGTEAKITKMPYQDGAVYFATDTNKIYLDSQGQRVPMGGSGASFYYTTQAEVPSNEETGLYTIHQSSFVDESAVAKTNDVLINTDGIWYRVANIEGNDYLCTRMAVSGGGGGVSYSEKAKLSKRDPASNYLINGREASISIYAISGRDTFDGTYLDEKLTVYWTLSEEAIDTHVVTQYAQGNFSINGTTDEDNPIWEQFEYGTKARFSAHNILKMYVKGSASEQSREISYDFFTSDLQLLKHPSFSNVNTYANDNLVIYCNVIGATDKIIYYYFDDELLNPNGTVIPYTNSTSEQSFTVPSNLATHGSHKVRIELYQYINGKADLNAGTAPIEMEIAVVEVGNPKAIIWLGDYQNQYYEYDSIKIPFRVFDPTNNLGAEITLFKDSNKIGSRTITDSSQFSIWEIVDGSLGEINYYTITCGVEDNEARKEIQFSVVEDPNRAGMKLSTAGLRFLFDASGRSNSESRTNREKYSYTDKNNNTIEAKFSNFNWYNNGWIIDSDTGNTCLRVSNGAVFSIPLKQTRFATSNSSNQSHTFEFQFKVRNVQDYSNIVHNITRYQGNTDDRYDTYPGWIDDEVYTTFNNKSYLDETWSDGKEYDNYDAFLQWYLPAHKAAFPDSTWPPSYDDIEYRKTEKLLSTNYAAGKYFDGQHGICIGAQDALFTNGVDTVNVSYVEDKLINLTIIYSHGSGSASDANSGSNRLMSIYLNGMLTGVARSTLNEAWNIGNDDNIELIFDSKYCDFDLYKIRVYNQPLTLPAVLTNYTVDLKDPVAYDLSQLAVINNSINESQLKYENMIAYNAAHPDGFIMPYIVFTTKYKDDNVLPYSKSKKIKDVQVEFVNTGLERAYATGELGELATRAKTSVEDYYMHHCPSWIADHVEMSVQGTSSEFYPRRNYKAKTKNAAPGSDTKEVQMWMNRGPFTQIYASEDEATRKQSHLDWFYYDNNTVGTTKFTLKIDYMESSGTYNMGFANLVKNAYTHHPLKDYYDKGAIQKAETQYNQAASYEEGTTYWYVNHKGNWKNTVEDELKIASAEDFALGPVAYAAAVGQTKVCTDESNEFYNKWYTADTVYVQATTPSYLDDYRTSVQGIPVLAFHQTTDAQGKSTGIKFIGRYNMLLDKGSDEAYGFKPVEEIYNKFVQRKGKPTKISKIAECWEAENNSRGFCSFRDASTNRTDDKFFDTGALTAAGAPVVADYWEYRYHDKADSLDILYALKDNISNQESIQLVKNELGESVDIGAPTVVTAPDGKYTGFTEGMQHGYDALLNLYSNWERAVRWVYSTDQDAVPSAGNYTEADVGLEVYAPNTYYILDASSNHVLDDSTEYSKKKTYYKSVGPEFEAIKLCASLDLVYAPNKFYIATPFGDKILDPDTEFNSEYEYFNLIADEANSGAEPLDAPVTYNGRTYNYDTKEYRNAKFTNDLSKHFNIEYLVTYFIMTEVFECYDSRGKNAMFGSWGPQEEGGDYIWYPMFYDIDTQLGINNTGIPSFEYYVDATENGTFSTNDSLLWNNLYKNFRSQIIQKYRQLRGKESTYGSLPHAPLQTVERIESWYLADPEVCNSIAMRGERPLIAFNLDEYYKYISITNKNVGYQDRSGGISYDNGTYFYALQGDRSLSRQQFLTNRFNYIDSWLNQGNYERGGTNIIRGRIAANSPSNTSDQWIEGFNKNTEPHLETDVSYWVDENTKTKKTHMFDGEYWITMEPVRNSYVTVGTDAANFPSLKYTNIDGPVRFETPDLENGVRTSGGYHEQLYYVYGLDQMKSLSDMSKLYWTEFNIEGSATKMTDLLLGYDGLDENNEHYKNSGINMYGIHASNSATDNGGMPLLKKVNLSYITFNDAAPTYNFTSCEKLEDFRAIGSNITNITFADGVALKTLYLPDTIKALNLTEATKLNNIVSTYVPRQDLAEPPVDVTPGLYIPGLTDGGNAPVSNIEQITLIGDCLGYDSYVLLNNYYKAREFSTSSKITVTEVDWSPYKLVDLGTEYDEIADQNNEYWLDDGHYGFKAYHNPTYEDWTLRIKNGELYWLDKDLLAAKQDLIVDTSLLTKLKNNEHFISTAEINYDIPIITGIMFINNSTAIDELEIQSTFASAYPNLKLFFANVVQHPAAKYVVLNDDGTYDLLARKTLDSGATNFPDPTDASSGILSSVELDRYDTRGSYDFYGWSTEPLNPAAVAALPDDWYESSQNHLLVTTNDPNSAALLPNQQYNKWNTFTLTEGVNDYTFYAVFGIHKYVMSYHLYVDKNGECSNDPSNIDKILIPAGQSIVEHTTIKAPYRDDTNLDFDKSWKFVGWALNEESTEPIEWSNATLGRASRDRRFYPVFKEASVYDNILSDDYLEFRVTNYGVSNDTDYAVTSGWRVDLKPNTQIHGKITLPITHEGLPICEIGDFRSDIGGNNITHIFFEKGDNKIRLIGNESFFNDVQLKYFEFPSGLRNIISSAFRGCVNLGSIDSEIDLSNTRLYQIGESTFGQAFKKSLIMNIKFPGTLTVFNGTVFAFNNSYLGTLTYGSVNDPIMGQLRLPIDGVSSQNPDIGTFASVILTMTPSAYNTLMADYGSKTAVANIFGVAETALTINYV